MAAAPSSLTPNEHTLPPELISYVHALSEPISIYTRYMDALLIKRPDHSAFYQDLKAFRCQPHIMALLTTPASPDFNSKDMFLAVTRLFLASRFAHPWCRTSQLKEGWFKAEWGSIKKQSKVKQKEEQRLHKLLLPIWCGFRVRMTPSEEVLKKWLEEERRNEVERKHVSADARIESQLEATDSVLQSEAAQRPSTAPAMQDGNLESTRSTPVNAEAYCMELDDHETNVAAKDEDAAAAAKLFVGIAATGFLASNKRARKYLMKKLNKKN